MTKIALAKSLFFANLGIFFLISAFLPQDEVYELGTVVQQYIIERDHWDIAFGATLGTSFLSFGIFTYLAQKLEGK